MDLVALVALPLSQSSFNPYILGSSLTEWFTRRGREESRQRSLNNWVSTSQATRPARHIQNLFCYIKT